MRLTGNERRAILRASTAAEAVAAVRCLAASPASAANMGRFRPTPSPHSPAAPDPRALCHQSLISVHSDGPVSRFSRLLVCVLRSCLVRFICRLALHGSLGRCFVSSGWQISDLGNWCFCLFLSSFTVGGVCHHAAILTRPALLQDTLWIRLGECWEFFSLSRSFYPPFCALLRTAGLCMFWLEKSREEPVGVHLASPWSAARSRPRLLVC